MEKGFVEGDATLGVTNLNMNKETFQVDDFLTDLDFIEMGEVQGDEEPFFDIQGAWRGKVTSTQQWINIESDFVKFIKIN